MGQNISKTTTNPFSNSNFLSSFERRSPTSERNAFPRPSIFATLKRPTVARPNDFTPLFSDCISAASTRTREYLVFKDPEDEFHPSPRVLTRVFLMTHVAQSVDLNLRDTFSCTATTPEQRVLPGADWVRALLEKAHQEPENADRRATGSCICPRRCRQNRRPPPRRLAANPSGWPGRSPATRTRTRGRWTSAPPSARTATFLFFGKRNEEGNVYGVLGNNFEAAVGKTQQDRRSFDRELLQRFSKYLRYGNDAGDCPPKKRTIPFTLTVKFNRTGS